MTFKRILAVVVIVIVFVEITAYVGLWMMGDFLPAPLKSNTCFVPSNVFGSKKALKVSTYMYGNCTFHPTLGWDNFTGLGERRSPVDLLKKDYCISNPYAVAFGDSFTYCAEVSTEESWQSQIKGMFGKKIVNMGVLSFGLDQAFLKFRLHAEKLGPKYVVLCLSDSLTVRTLGRLKNFLEYFPAGPVFKPRFTCSDNELKLLKIPFDKYEDYSKYTSEKALYKLVKDDGWYNFYKKNFGYDLIKGWGFPFSADFVLFAEKIYEYKKRGLPLDLHQLLEKKVIPETLETCRVSAAILKAFDTECRKFGSIPLIVIINQPRAPILNELRGECMKKKVNLYDVESFMTRELAEANISFDISCFIGSAHYTPFGNNIIAQKINSIFDFISARGRGFTNRGQSDAARIKEMLFKQKADLSHAFFSCYLNYIIKAVPDTGFEEKHREIFERLIEQPFSTDNISDFISTVNSRTLMSVMNITREVRQAVTAIRRFSEALGYVDKADRFFHKKRFVHAENALERALILVPGWKNCIDLLVSLRKGSIASEYSGTFKEIVTRDLQKRMDLFKSSYFDYKKGLRSIVKDDFISSEKFLEDSVKKFPAFLDSVFTLGLVKLIRSNEHLNSCSRDLKKSTALVYTAKNGDEFRHEYYVFLIFLSSLLSGDYSTAEFEKIYDGSGARSFFARNREALLPVFENMGRYKKPKDFLKDLQNAEQSLSLARN